MIYEGYDVGAKGILTPLIPDCYVLCTLAILRLLLYLVILKQYQKLLALDEVNLKFDDGALHAIARKAMKKDTGARALRAIIEEFMLDIMYEIPKDDSIGEVTITEAYIEGTGGPLIELRSQSVPRLEHH